MPSHALDVQKAIVTALTAALAPVPVYDIAPQDAPYPFVEIASQQVKPVTALTPLSSDFAEHLVYLAIWSAYRGQKEVLEIIAKIRAAMHNGDSRARRGRLRSLPDHIRGIAPRWRRPHPSGRRHNSLARS